MARYKDRRGHAEGPVASTRPRGSRPIRWPSARQRRFIRVAIWVRVAIWELVGCSDPLASTGSMYANESSIRPHHLTKFGHTRGLASGGNW